MPADALHKLVFVGTPTVDEGGRRFGPAREEALGLDADEHPIELIAEPAHLKVNR